MRARTRTRALTQTPPCKQRSPAPGRLSPSLLSLSPGLGGSDPSRIHADSSMEAAMSSPLPSHSSLLPPFPLSDAHSQAHARRHKQRRDWGDRWVGSIRQLLLPGSSSVVTADVFPRRDHTVTMPGPRRDHAVTAAVTASVTLFSRSRDHAACASITAACRCTCASTLIRIPHSALLSHAAPCRVPLLSRPLRRAAQ